MERNARWIGSSRFTLSACSHSQICLALAIATSQFGVIAMRTVSYSPTAASTIAICSRPRRRRRSAAASAGSRPAAGRIAGAVVLVWVSLAVSVAAVAGAAAFAVVRGLATWRGVRTLSRAAADASVRLTEGADAASAKADALGEGSERLAEAAERLSRSRARLAVLTAALADVRAGVSRATWVLPRK
jgi:hypothetical protein